MKITSKELTYIKELTTANQILASKLSTYAHQSQDNEVKTLFQNAADTVSKSLCDLINMLD